RHGGNPGRRRVPARPPTGLAAPGAGPERTYGSHPRAYREHRDRDRGARRAPAGCGMNAADARAERAVLAVSGRGWAYLGAGGGGAVWVAASVPHSSAPPATAGPGWRPHPGAVVGAVFWPVALLVAVEILARVEWPPAARWIVLRWLGLA